jgi:collagen type I/II/III/V/XI/XXIV/XXVII alpha
LTNDGTIVGGYFGGAGVALASGTLTNDAVIGGGSGGGTGITLAGGILANGGTIAGGDGGGIGVDLAAGSLTNNGTIGGGAGTNGIGSNGLGGSGGAGVDLPAGSLINKGTIVGGTGGYGSLRPGDGGGGIALGMQPAIGGTLTNDGTIIGGAGGAGGAARAYGISTAYGGIGVLLSVLLTSGGTLTNDGAIVGGAGGTGDGVGGMGVRFDTTGMLTNHGTITGGGAASNGGVGVLLNSGGTLTNDGTIVGGGGSIGAIGVQINFAGTLTNAGFIGGGASDGGRADAVYFGRYFDSTASRLILDPGASFGGAVVANPSFSNVMELATGDGTGTIAGLGDTITGFAAIQFDADAAWVIEGSAAGLATGQTIAGFAAGDTIELAGVTAIGSIYSSGTLTLMQTSGSVQLHFPDLPESVTAASFIVHNAAAGVDVSLAAPCFAAGTRILTTRGAVAVEALQIGDLVPVLMGSGVEPIVWLGFRHVDCTRHPHPEDVWPVRLSRGAFGPGQPSRDLWLSPDHAVFINGVLIPIRYLVNGRTIRQEPRDTISYWHVELTRHDVLYAEGVLAETYLDTSNRKNFSNGYGPVALHADFAPRVWEAEGCAPLVVTGPILDATRQRLNNRAGAMRYTMAAPGRRRTPARNA